jgi:hypothetical protein
LSEFPIPSFKPTVQWAGTPSIKEPWTAAELNASRNDVVRYAQQLIAEYDEWALANRIGVSSDVVDIDGGTAASEGTRIQLRRDTATNWTTLNPILDSGEIAVESDTGKLKVGDGTTAWTSLSYDSGTLPSTVVTDTSDLETPTGLYVTGPDSLATYETSWWFDGYVFFIKWTPDRTGRISFLWGPPVGIPDGSLSTVFMFTGQQENVDYPGLGVWDGTTNFPVVNDINRSPVATSPVGAPEFVDVVGGQPYTFGVNITPPGQNLTPPEPDDGIDCTPTILPLLQSLQAYGPTNPSVPWPDGAPAISVGGKIRVPPALDSRASLAVSFQLHASSGGSQTGPLLPTDTLILTPLYKQEFLRNSLVISYQDVMVPGGHFGLHYSVNSKIRGLIVDGVDPEIAAMEPAWFPTSFAVVKTDGSEIYVASNYVEETSGGGPDAARIIDQNSFTYNATFLDWVNPVVQVGSDLSNPEGTNYIQTASGGPFTVTLIAAASFIGA